MEPYLIVSLESFSRQVSPNGGTLASIRMMAVNSPPRTAHPGNGVYGQLAELAELAELYRAHYQPLARAAYFMVGDRDLAEDIVQEAFIKIHQRGLRHLRDKDKALSYLRRTVANQARSQLRRRAIARRLPPRRSIDEESAENEAQLEEDRRLVVRGLMYLSTRQRECLVLRYYLDMSEREVARTLSLSSSSVKTHTQRGLVMLSRRLEAGHGRD